MKRATWMVLGWLVLGFTAQAASFDCAKAQSKVEHLICDNAEISKLDEELNAAYKTEVQDKQQADTVKQAQKQWMKERNNCADAECVERAYKARLSTLATMHTAPDVSVATKEEAKDSSQNGQQYYFQLTKGKGVAVCDAYLERLNSTEYVKPPFCDRPENDAVKGFIKLSRVPLSPADIRDLYPIISDFIGMANHKNVDWTDANLQQRLTQTGHAKLSEDSLKSMQRDLDQGVAKMWRYAPPVDIDNDGVADNVQVWHGYVLNGSGGRQCGADISDLFPSDTLLRQPQQAFVITGSNDRLDVSKTTNIFAHPKGGYRFYSKVEKKWKVSSDFRPIGKSMGLFKYQDQYYFDTFFDGWGDFENKRQTVNAQIKGMQIANTLAVFLHKDGATKQVCEYLMTDNETQRERGAK